MKDLIQNVYIECIYKFFHFSLLDTVMILSFGTERSGQTVQTQIRLLLDPRGVVWSGSTLLEEQTDQGLHWLQFHLHHLDTLLYGKASLFKFKDDYSQFFRCPNF